MNGLDRFYKRQKDKDKNKENKLSAVSGMERYNQNRTYDASVVNDEYYQNFIKEAKDLLTNFDNPLKDDTRYKSWQELSKKYRTLNTWLRKNQNNLSEDAYKSISESIGSFSQINDYFSKFKSEDEYKENKKISDLYNMSSEEITPYLDDSEKKSLVSRQQELQEQMRELGNQTKGKGAIKKQQLQKELNEINKQISEFDKSAIAFTTSGGQNITWQSLYDNKKDEEDFNALYNEMSAMPDWEEKSKYIPTYDTSKGRNPFNPGDDDYERANFPAISVNGTQDIYYALQTNEKEKELFNYLAHTKGTDYAISWLLSRENIYKERQTNQSIELAQKFAKEVPIISDATAIVGSAIVSPFEYLVNVATGNAGETTNSAAMSSAIKSTRMEQIDWEVGEWDAFDFLYGTGTSMAESALAMATFGNVGGAVLGLSAAAQSTNDALNRGMSKGQAFTSGVAAGIFEGVFESWSFGAFSDLTKNLKRVDLRNMAKYIGKNMWNNAKEETLTEIANVVYDTLINGDFSQYETTIRQYVASGMSESDARRKVAVELGAQVAEAGASGALMGFGFGAGGAISTTYHTAQSGKAIKKAGEVGNLVDLGKSLGEGTESYDLANQINDKSSALAIGSLLGVAQEDINSANRGDIVKSLERKGFDTEKANQLADLMLDSENTLFANSKGFTAEGKTYNDIVSNPNSTVGQRTQSYLEILDNLEKGKTTKENTKTNTETKSSQVVSVPYSAEYIEGVAKEFEAMGIPAEQARMLAEKKLSTPSEANSSPTEKNIVETKYDVSDDGKTTNLKTGTAVEIKNIADISSSGEANLTLDDGAVVKASDISFSSPVQAVFVENIGKMKVGKKPISATSANVLYKHAMDAWKKNPKMTADEAMSLIKGLVESYIYGTYNLGRERLTARNEDGTAVLFAGELSQEQRKHAYELGVKDSVSKAEADQKVIDELKEKSKGKTAKKSFGKIIFEDGINVDESTLTDTQKANLNGIKLLADLTSVEFHVFRSDRVGNTFKYSLPNGKKTSANGWFVAGTNQIWIDLNAGNVGEGTMLRTAAHEISHYIKAWSPTKWKAMADLLMQTFADNNVNTERMLNRQKDKIKRRYTKKDMPSESKLLDMAYEELVSDALTDMLTDGSIVNFIAEVKAKDKNLAQRILDAIKNLLKNWGLIIDDYKGRDLDTPEAQALSQFEDTFKKLQEMYRDALMDANETVATIGARNLADFAEAKNTEGESLFQYRAMEADESTYKDMLRKWGKITDAQIDNLFTTIDKAMDIIKDNLEALDYAWESDIDDRAFSPVKPNSDSLYQVSLDFSTLCRKRILQQTIQAQLQEALNQPLSREEGIAIRDALIALQEEGRQIEVACALCYVESARMKSPAQIKKFLNTRETVLKEFFAGKSGGSMKAKIKQAETDTRENIHKENPNGIKGKDGSMLDPRTASLKAMPKKYADLIREAKRNAKAAYNPTAEEQKLIDVAKGMSVSDFTSPEGLENLAKNYPALFDAYTSYVRNATKSKGIEGDTWWRAGDSQKIGDVLIANMNKENGLRSQSWSDFQVIHILDYIAATIELSTRNAKEQAYSKVPDYVELMGQTGVMINMSLIPTRNFNGSLEYDSVEGMDYKRALELREKYPSTAGTICIGIDNKQIQMLLADANIDYVIPYHKSGMAASIRKLMHIPTWTQYEEYQSEKNLSRKDAEAQAKKYGVALLEESDPNYHKHTSFSEWFDLEVAKQIAKMENANPSNKAMQKKYGVMYGGYMAMQDAANNYLKLCAERGIAPKFSHENADFTAEDNYWKLLIDRKMVNNATGEIIEQQTIKPIFDEGEVLRILNDELERYPSVKEDQEYATRKVTEKFLSGEIKSGMSAEAIAKVMKTPVDNITKTNIVASTEGETIFSERDFSYDELVAKGDLQGVVIDKTQQPKLVNGIVDVGWILKKVREKCETLTRKGGVVYYTNVPDIGENVEIVRDGITHGFARPDDIKNGKTTPNAVTNARVALAIPQILNNSIEVNRSQRGNNIDVPYTHVLIGTVALENSNGVLEYYVVRSMVQERKNQNPILVKTDILGVLTSVNAKKIGSPNAWVTTKNGVARTHGKAYTYRVSDLLNDVKDVFGNTFSVDVYQHLGMTRIKDDFSDNLLFSERVSNKELASMDDTALYIKNTKKANYIGMIFNGTKTEETRSQRTLDAFIGKDFYVTDGKMVYGSIVLGEPHKYTEAEFHKLENRKKHRVPKGDEYDVKPGGIKWAYPIESYSKFDKPKKLSDSKEYKNSFQARQVMFSDRDSEGNALTKEQQEFFKDSKVRDKDGNLLVVYHGTSAEFTVFDIGRSGQNYEGSSQFGRGMYFAGGSNGAWGWSFGGKVKPYYLDIKNPFFAAKETPKELLELVGATSNVWAAKRGELFIGYLNSKGIDSTEFLKKHGYDGIVDESATTGYPGMSAKDLHQYVVFSPEQIKNIDNKTPTTDPDVRYSDRDKIIPTGIELPEGTKVDKTGKPYSAQAQRDAGYMLNETKFNQFYSAHKLDIGKQWGDILTQVESIKGEGFKGGSGAINTLPVGISNIRMHNGEPIFDNVIQKAYAPREGEYILLVPKNWVNKDGKVIEGFKPFDYEVVQAERDYQPYYEMYTKAYEQAYINGEDTKYSDRDTSTSNRAILANALEGTAQNDIEKNKLAQYKEKIALIETEEKRLSEIQKQLFTKGAVEPSQRKELQFEAKQIANRINTYDRQLLNLESTAALKNVLNREKALAMKRQKQKDTEYLKQYKEKVAKTQRELLTRHQESRKNAMDSRHRTAMREKIKKTVNELNTLLLKGSKERNVKLGLQDSVAKALEVVNMDTVGADERIAKLEQDLLKAKTPEEIQKISRTIDRIREQGDNLADKLESMKNAYAEIRRNSNKDYAQYYQQEAELIEYVIADVIESVGDTPLRKMTLPQLEKVYNMYRVVLQTIRYSNELHNEGKVEELRKNASSMMAELEKIKTLKEERAAFGDTIRGFSWNEMIPIYAVRRTGSQTLEKFFWEMIRGQNTYAKDVNEANDFSTAIREKYGHSKWDLNKVHEFTLADGRTFRLTLEHMMSIYAYSKREQAYEHMTTGGFFFNDKATFRKKGGILKLIKSNEEGYTVDTDVLNSIIDTMEKEAKGSTGYVDEMQDYLTKMGEKGNEVSRVVWGIDIFKEKIYFPLKSSRDFIFQANQTAQETSLKHDGMTKETKPGASNPIILEAFDDVWANHVNRMSQYHGFVIPIDNMNKLLNYGSWAGTSSVSVTTMLRARFGESVNEYFNDFIKDINGASSTSGASNPFFSFVGKFKKTAVAASSSVVVQQPTAILRASAVMDSKYFVGLPESHLLSTKWNELQKYAPITIIKEIGGFDAGAGRQASEWLNSDTRRGIDKIEGKIDDITMKGAAIGDQIGWCTIWEAVKREIKATTNLKEGSEEFLNKAGERFTEVIVLTQVYDSTLSRSGYMRSKHDSVKMLTSFMGEPTVSINMMHDAFVQAKRKTIPKRKAVRIIGATYASIIAASIAASLIYALRDDDEDESYLEKFAEAFGGKLLGDINPLNMLPGFRDIISIFDGWDVERTDMAVFKDIKDAFDGLFSENKNPWRKVEDFSGAVASAFGVPLKNLLRTGREIYNGIKVIFDDITPSGVGDAFKRGITGEKKNKNNALYDAIVSGDTAKLEIYRQDYKDDKSYETAVRKVLRENDPRIKEAAEARNSGDIAEYTRIVKEIKAEGFFSQDTIVASVNAEINAINKGESTSTETSATEDKESSIYKMEDYYDSIVGGDQASAYVVKEDLINIDVENGKDREEAEKDFNSKFASYIREQYEDGNVSEYEAKNLLTQYGEQSSEEATSKVQYWAFKEDYPDYDDLSEEAVAKYYSDVEPYGISIGVYYDYSKQKAKCKGVDSNGDGKTDSGSKKKEILNVINSLPLTYAQKDVLYYLNGWSAKTINEAPWH